MKQAGSFHNSSASQRNLFVPMLLIALVLHGVFLMLPTGADTEKPEASEDNAKAQVQPIEPPSVQPTPQLLDNQLNSTLNPQTLALRRPTPQPSESDSETESDARPIPRRATPVRQSDRTSSQTNQRTRSQATSTRRNSSTRAASESRRESNPQSSNSSRDRRTSATSDSSQEQKASATSTSSQEQRASGIPTFSQQQSPLAASNLPQEPKQPETPPPPKPVGILSETFLRDFPYYLGSLLTSGGLLKPEFDDPKQKYIYHTVDEIEKVATNFDKQLTEKGFKVTQKTNEDNFKVYEVVKGTTTQFLHLVFKDGKTAIFLDDKEHKLDELQQEKPENSLPALIQFYDTFKEKVRDNQDLHLQKLNQSDLDRFPEAEVLKATNTEAGELEIDTLLLDQLEAIASPSHPISSEQLASSITNNLSNGEDAFKVEKIGTHGGGELYEVTK
ncbi:MAG: hypothetical protein LDL41_23685, partial [Coleofasciculus sp. S288]|nr:hypothetical protein [Coleofasciculus sp. S288]